MRLLGKPRSQVAAVVGGASLVAAVVYSLLGSYVHGPGVFGDELIYMEAARSLAHDGSLVVRDAPYRFGPLYPGLLAPLVWIGSGPPEVYALAKILNACLFALASVPTYLLARRVLPRGWSAGVAVLAVALPSSAYTGLVLTEGLAYLLAAASVLAIVVAVERPTVWRQVGALAVVLVTAAARPQLAVLGVGALLALVISSLAEHRCVDTSVGLRRLWPTALALALAAGAAVAVVAARGGSAASGLGGYATLWRSYSLAGVLRWSWYSVGGLALYMAFVPMLAAPAACATIFGRYRSRHRQELALASVFLAVNAAVIVAVGAFLSTPFGAGRLHDRYLFYVVPLWLVAAAWALRTEIRRMPLAAATALTLLAVATLPTHLILGEGVHLDAIGNGVWSEIAQLAPGRPNAVRAVALACVLALAAALLLLPPRLRVLLVLPVAATFLANAVLVWNYRMIDGGRGVFSPRTEAAERWVDRALPAGTQVTTLWIGSGGCKASLVRDGFLWTEFFNERLQIGARIGSPSSDSLRFHEVHVDPTGRIVLASGRVFAARLVVTPPGLDVDGRLVASGTAVGLRLWETTGAIRLRGARSDADAIRRACS